MVTAWGPGLGVIQPLFAVAGTSGSQWGRGWGVGGWGELEKDFEIRNHIHANTFSL